MVLLHPDLANGEARTPEGAQQLMPGVEQSLEPGPRSRPHGEHPPHQREGPAVGGQLGTSQLGPGLPKPCQVAILLPLVLKRCQTSAQTDGGCSRSREQEGHIADNPLFKAAAFGAKLAPTPPATGGGSGMGHA